MQCNEKLNQEERLISKQIYELNGKKIKQDPITILSKTSVNKKILGTPIKLMIYNLSNSNAEEDFEKWLNKKENRIEKKIKTFGYDQVELDENGFRSGSLNKKAGIGK